MKVSVSVSDRNDNLKTSKITSDSKVDLVLSDDAITKTIFSTVFSAHVTSTLSN